MYKKWRIEDIKSEIDKIGMYLDYKCDIPIEISSRATKRMGAFFFHRRVQGIEPVKFVFAKVLVDGNYSEEVVREVIIHEYLHYYCDTKSGKSNGHNKVFKEMCVRLGIAPQSTFKYDPIKNENINKKEYLIYCKQCGKLVCVHKRKDATLRKINNYVSKCCRSKLEYKL